jgi:hypothetical protein
MSQSVVTYSLLGNGWSCSEPVQRYDRSGITVVCEYEMAEYWIIQISLNFRFVQCSSLPIRQPESS